MDACHVFRHDTCPFEHLGADIYQEGIAGPSTENFDTFGGVVHHKKRHGCAGPDGSGAKVLGFESKTVSGAFEAANRLQEGGDACGGDFDFSPGVVIPEGANGCVGGR